VDPALIPALFDALTVARLGSVGAAARRLNKTPSAVSQQIRRLTEAFEVPLFEKRGRRVTLTKAGERIVPAATRLFDEAEAVSRLFGELTGEGETTLRLAASDYLAKPLLVPVLRDLAAEGVPLHFEITTVHSEEGLSLVERGEVEMAIVSFSGERAGLETVKLFEQPFFWVGDERSAEASSLAERIARGPVIRLAPGSIGRKLLDRYLEQHDLRPRSTIDVPSVSLLLAYATGGVGIGLVPALPLSDATLRDVRVERASVGTLPVRLVTRARRKSSSAVERFVHRLTREAMKHSGKFPTAAGVSRRKSSAK
jgi:DNA-binding transcriptional LysR family regulator